MTSRAAFAVLLAVGLASAASGQDVPALTGRVVDLADLLSPPAEAALVQTLAAHEDSMSNQVVVLTIPSLEGEVLEEYATHVFRTWGLGQGETDNGVLFLVAVAERQVRIEVGYGLEGALTDASAGSIIRGVIVPRFKEGQFEAGILAGATAILGVIEGTYVPPASGGDELAWWGVALFLLFPVTWGIASLSFRPLGRYLMAVPMAVITGLTSAAIASIFGVSNPEAVGWGVGGGLAFLLLYGAVDAAISSSERGSAWRAKQQRVRRAIREARAAGRSSVVVNGVSYSTESSSGDGGGFSGGGGSSGGGGASGSW